jgi:hypothetical protein
MTPSRRFLQLALGSLVAGCSTSAAPADDAGPADSSLADVVYGTDAGVRDGAGDAGSDGSSCACTPGGACDTFGCPPDYNDATAFAAWCATVQAAAAGHVVSMRTCGSLLLVTYGTDGGREKGYAVDENEGTPVATLDECGGTALTCTALDPSACVPGCCLDKSCTLGIASLCPPWQPDGGDAGDANAE